MEGSKLLLKARRFEVVQHSFQSPDGACHTREIVEHPGSATILPLFDDGRVCLIRNQRIAVGGELIELPAGTLDPGEAPAETARRELEEETGYRARSIELLTAFFVSPGILNERMHLYVATGLNEGQMRLDAGEEIERLIVTWHEALEMARDGRIQDAKTLVGLLFYDRFRAARPQPC